ncbi:MAG: non-canonical purine NTP pyrophosphatase [Chloroflexota bacterium]
MTTFGGSRPRLLVATRSEHKLRELRELLALPNAELVTLDEVGVDGEPVEDGESFEANAAIKARAGLAASGVPTLADDSGIEVDALDGAPGVRTRRYAGDDATDEQNNQKLLAALEGLPAERRGAHYVCSLVLAMPGEPLITVRGECAGRIATGPRGSGGFGYDPIFEPDREPPGGRTFGQWSAEDKNRVSHRARAAQAMTPYLVDRGF